jgi:hypothetical protein
MSARIKLALWSIACVCALASLVFQCASDQKKKRPSIQGWITMYGTVEQKGDNVSIRGHERWEADGFFRRDGRLYLAWMSSPDEYFYPALYEFGVNGVLVGEWGYEDDVRFVPDIFKGKITGRTMPTYLSRIEH